MNRLRLWAAGAAALIALFLLAPSSPSLRAESPPEGRFKVLFLGDGGHHRPDLRLRDLAPAMLDRGIELVYTEDLDALNPHNLARYPVILLYGNHPALSPEQEKALIGFVESGGGLVALHSASAMFTNSSAYIALIGAEFAHHGEGTVSTRVAEPEHPAMAGFEPFTSWDETYVHRRHNLQGRTVLEYRGSEPWTWVREQGDGRVFYTAWGHDHRTWRQPGFHDLVARGIRWAAFLDPSATSPAESPFHYAEASVPYYPPPGRPLGGRWASMQLPLPPEESMKRIIVPGGFRLELFASEPLIRNPIAMNWDERGRLWVIESYDYPNALFPSGRGNDRILILEDTTGDGRADTAIVFAEGLNIATGLAFYDGGVIVAQAPHTLFLKDSDGDGRADVRRVLFSGWGTFDSHAGPSNLRYGLDNWIWGTVGYSGFNGWVGGRRHVFHDSIYRFRPDGSDLEFVHANLNNTWGLGQSEEGFFFASNANAAPSAYVPFARPSEEAPFRSERLPSIAADHRFLPVTERIRQVDVHGGFTAAAGHAVYTARAYPPEYWNQTAFVAEPTGNLVAQMNLKPNGAGFRAENPSNLLVSDDEWVSPIAAEVGPDGAVWVIDWYNYIIQHNPTPPGHRTGRGNAYETPLRDSSHGRIYRVVWEEAPPYEPVDLSTAAPDDLVKTLTHPNQFWRLHAQRLLVERGRLDVESGLIALVQDADLDEIGLNPGAVHALWTLHGLGALDGEPSRALDAAYEALRHPSAGVRHNALRVLPRGPETAERVLNEGLLEDPDASVRLAALLALAESPPSESAGAAVHAFLLNPANAGDLWLREAAAMAAAQHASGFLAAARAAADGGPAGAEAENLAVNPDFETLTVVGTPFGWRPHTWSGLAEFNVEEGAGRSGGNAVKISSTIGADASWNQTIRVEPHTRYRLSAWIKVENVRNTGGGLGAMMNIHELGGQGGGRTRAIAGTTDWEYVETEFDSGPHRTLTLLTLFGGWGRSTGAAWFDEITLTKARSEDYLPRLVDHLAARRPDPAPAAPGSSVAESDPQAAEISVSAKNLSFDPDRFQAKAGQTVRIRFVNADTMQHNMVIARPGTLEEVGGAADAMLSEADAYALHYVPQIPEVIAATPVVTPGGVHELVVTFPDEPGEYVLVCTFPGHWRIMNGVIEVTN